MKLIKHHGTWQITHPYLDVQEGDAIEVTTTYLPCKIKNQTYTCPKCDGCIPRRDLPKKVKQNLLDAMHPDSHICIRSGSSYWIKFNNRKKK